ncbi:hypothetical protein MNBD_UNCLBAC01-1132 [hydrothermal vent metagenome]|uniref:Dienelactone hydrolase domain-containing protein n=1 Tax=hydrothermal vent metagenome TaxID=652676 RepID=A0A3B1DAR8_9ZZZZ
MKKIILNFFLLIFLFQNNSFAQGPQRYEGKLKLDFSQTYLVQLPENYDRSKKYPLFIAVPWASGTAEQQYEQWNKHANRDQYILLCPRFKYGFQWFKAKGEDVLLQIMHELYYKFPYDKKKVYLVGASAGALFAHNFAFKHPNLVHAVGVFATEEYAPVPTTARARRVKFFIGIGEKDKERMEATSNFYEDLKEKGFDVEMKIFLDTVHGLDVDMKRDFMEYLKK